MTAALEGRHSDAAPVPRGRPACPRAFARAAALAGAAALLAGCGGGSGPTATSGATPAAPAATAPAATAPAPSGDWAISPAGTILAGRGAAVIGQPFSAVVAAWGPPVGCKRSGDCARPDGPDTVGWPGVNVDVAADGTVMLIRALAGPWRTAAGARLSSRLATLRRLYGARLTPVPQDATPVRDPVSYLVLEPPGALGLVMGGSLVIQILVGSPETIRRQLAEPVVS
jgi:hypothetical protein